MHIRKTRREEAHLPAGAATDDSSPLRRCVHAATAGRSMGAGPGHRAHAPTGYARLQRAALGLGCALLSLALWPAASYAIGSCEDLTDTFEIKGVSAKQPLLAVARVREWCQDKGGTESRASFAFTEMVDAKGKRAQAFLEDPSPDALKQFRRRAGKGARPKSELAAALQQGAFEAPTPVTTPTSKGCIAKVVVTATPSKAHKGAVPYAISLEVRRGADLLHTFKIAEGEGPGDAQPSWRNVYWFPAARGIAGDLLVGTTAGFQDPNEAQATIYERSRLIIHSAAGLAGCF